MAINLIVHVKSIEEQSQLPISARRITIVSCSREEVYDAITLDS